MKAADKNNVLFLLRALMQKDNWGKGERQIVGESKEGEGERRGEKEKTRGARVG